jgi:hypothetical protein
VGSETLAGPAEDPFMAYVRYAFAEARHERPWRCRPLRDEYPYCIRWTPPSRPPAVSTSDQDLSIQEAALRAAGCDTIRAEKCSGTTAQGRHKLPIVLDFLWPGDALMVISVDRLARSIGSRRIAIVPRQRRPPVHPQS